jgi:hypothetical protein
MLFYAYGSSASLDVVSSQKQQYACAVGFVPPMYVPGLLNIHGSSHSKHCENPKTRTGLKHFGPHSKTKFGALGYKS